MLPDPASGPPHADPLLRWREEFPIVERCTYLVSHSLGAMPRGARRGLLAYADAWEHRGVRAWNEGWWSLPIQLGDELAPLLGAPPGSIAMQPNVTLATALFLSALDFPVSRPRLVSVGPEFPSLLYLYDGLRASGAEIATVASDDGVTIPEDRLLSAIDDRTRVVALSHVLFRSSFVLDVPAIVHRAREVGALVLLDVYQSAGCLPVTLSAWGVDAAVGGCLKWLCGGPGNAFLYVRPDLAEHLSPRLTGWQAHSDPFAFAPPPIERATGAWRFLHGTPAIPALYAARAGIEIVGSAGIESIREKSRRQTGRILERAAGAGWPVRTPSDPERRGGTVSIECPESYAVSRELLAGEIVVDYRPGAGVRMAPHFYTADSEIDHALDAMEDTLRSGSYRRHLERARDIVT